MARLAQQQLSSCVFVASRLEKLQEAPLPWGAQCIHRA